MSNISTLWVIVLYWGHLAVPRGVSLVFTCPCLPTTWRSVHRPTQSVSPSLEKPCRGRTLLIYLLCKYLLSFFPSFSLFLVLPIIFFHSSCSLADCLIFCRTFFAFFNFYFPSASLFFSSPLGQNEKWMDCLMKCVKCCRILMKGVKRTGKLKLKWSYFLFDLVLLPFLKCK